MAIIRRLFGPFAPETAHPNTAAAEVRWSFFGITGDHTTEHWTLVFKAEDRKFYVVNSRIGKGDSLSGPVIRAVTKTLPREYPTAPALPGAYLDDRPVLQGRITDMLKSRLTPEDFAKCTRLAMGLG